MDHRVSVHPPEEGRLGCFSGDGFVTSLKEAREHPPIHPHRTPPQQRITQLRMSVAQRWRSAVQNTS